MKIAIATEGDSVAMHFGRCGGYTIFEIKDNKVVSEKYEEAPEHQPGLMPKWLSSKGADLVIAGGAGAMARELFGRMGIRLILGAGGPVKEALKKYLDGSLGDGESLCDNSGSCSH